MNISKSGLFAEYCFAGLRTLLIPNFQSLFRSSTLSAELAKRKLAVVPSSDWRKNDQRSTFLPFSGTSKNLSTLS